MIWTIFGIIVLVVIVGVLVASLSIVGILWKVIGALAATIFTIAIILAVGLLIVNLII